MAKDFQHFRNELDRLRPQVDDPEVVRLLDSLIDQLERQHEETSRKFERLTENLRELDNRILTVENSRVFRVLHKASHTLRAWRSRRGTPRLSESNARAYQLWLERQEHAAPPEQWFRNAGAQMQYQPRFSILLHLDNPRREWLEATIESVLRQSYPEWELCISDDACAEPWVSSYVEQLVSRDPRIHFVRSKQSMGPSSSLNRAMILTSGGYIATLSQHGLLSPHAFCYAAEALQVERFDLLYTDHDYIGVTGSRERPCFKPGWSPELLDASMYLGRFLIVSKSALIRAGEFQSELDDAHLHDLVLRLMEAGSTVFHIPRVLVSEHDVPDPDSRAVEAALVRRKCQAVIEPGPNGSGFRIHRKVLGTPLVSLIICSRNARLLEKCLDSIERKTSYARREIVVVQHSMTGAGDRRMARLLDRSKSRRVTYTGAFNFAAMNNAGIESSNGEIVVFMNDDVGPLDTMWLNALVAQAERPEIGVVGAQLVYPSGLIQHAGIAIGMMDGAGHPHRETAGGGFWNWSFHARNVSAVTGACLAIRREVFEQLNGFDINFPVNYNDVDLCLRAGQAGFEVIYEPAARLEHGECKTRAPGVRWEERELFQARWGELLEKGDPYYSRHLARNREDCSLRDG